VVAGYGKTVQLLRRPFRTYYAELDRLVTECDGALFLGYGFGDIHLNMAFEKFRDAARRPVVVLDYADDADTTAGGADWDGRHRTVTSAMGIFRINPHDMRWLGHTAPGQVGKLKVSQDFEVCSEAATPLALWYNGMLAATKNATKVIKALT
jgi:hypothetical protein